VIALSGLRRSLKAVVRVSSSSEIAGFVTMAHSPVTGPGVSSEQPAAFRGTPAATGGTRRRWRRNGQLPPSAVHQLQQGMYELLSLILLAEVACPFQAEVRLTPRCCQSNANLSPLRAA